MFKRRKNLSLVLSLLTISILSVTYLLVLNVNFKPEDPSFVPEYKENIYGERPLEFNDNWEFYPNMLIDTFDDFDLYKDTLNRIDPSKKLEADFGTYRIVIDEPFGVYGFNIKSINNAYMVYVNKVQIGGAGQVATELEHHIPDSKDQIMFGTADIHNQMELIIHTSRFSDEENAVLDISFASPNIIMSNYNKKMLIESILSFSLIGLAIYYFVLFKRHKDLKFLKSLALMALASSILISNSSIQILRTYLPYSYGTQTTLQALSILLICFSFIDFLQILLERFDVKKHKERLFKITKYLLLVNIVLVLIPSSILSGAFVTSITLLSLSITIILSFFVIITEIFKGNILSSELAFIGISILQVMALFFIKAKYNINTGHLFQFLILSIILTNTLAIFRVYKFNLKFVKQLKEVLLVSERKISSFILALSENVLNPLKTVVDEIETFDFKDLDTSNEQTFGKFKAIQNQSQELVYLLQSVYASYITSDYDTNTLFDTHNLHDFVEKNIRLFIATNNVENITISNEVNKDLVAYFDDEQLSIVIHSLLSNALKSIEDSGDIKIKSKDQGDYITLTIEDNGRGIEAKHLPYIFEEFYKIEQDNDDSSFGIGLFVVKRIIENHNGYATMRSTVNVGTSVSISLPVGLDNRSLSIAPKSTAFNVDYKTVKNNERVMLCSNDEKLIETFEGLYKEIEVFNYNGRNSGDLISTINTYHPDVFILDYNDDRIINDNLLSMLRENYRMFELPILLIINKILFMNMKSTDQKIANDILTYPIDKDSLINKITKLKENKESVAMGIEKEFKYLYSQIYPHFLYNTLNTIVGLSYTDSETSRQALLNFSLYLRAKLDIFKRDSFVSIHEELELIEAYIGIEKLRFNGNFNFNVSIEPGLDFKVPSLLVQNLIENSFRHGFDSNRKNNVLTLEIYRKSNKIHIFIEDNGCGMDDETQKLINDNKESGLGYNNTFKRISLIKGSTFNLSSQIGFGTQIKITIPEVD